MQVQAENNVHATLPNYKLQHSTIRVQFTILPAIIRP